MKNIISNEYGHCHYCVCKEENCGMIYNLYVKEEYRKQGHATTFIQEAIKDIRNAGFNMPIKIKAEPEENSMSKEDLIKFYKKMNLKIVN